MMSGNQIPLSSVVSCDLSNPKSSNIGETTIIDENTRPNEKVVPLYITSEFRYILLQSCDSSNPKSSNIGETTLIDENTRPNEKVVPLYITSELRDIFVHHYSNLHKQNASKLISQKNYTKLKQECSKNKNKISDTGMYCLKEEKLFRFEKQKSTETGSKNKLCKEVMCIEHAYDSLLKYHHCSSSHKTYEALKSANLCISRPICEQFVKFCAICRSCSWGINKKSKIEDQKKYEEFQILKRNYGTNNNQQISASKILKFLMKKHKVDLNDGREEVFTMSSKYADILTKNDKNKDHIMINKNLKPMTSNKIEYQDMYTDATTKQTNLSNELKNDQQFKILIDEIELQLKIATGCYDYKLCHIVFLCTENNNGFRQQFHTDWNGSNDLINDDSIGKKRKRKEKTKEPKFFFLLAIDNHQGIHIKDNKGYNTVVLSQNKGIIGRDDLCHADANRKGRRMQGMFINPDEKSPEHKFNLYQEDRNFQLTWNNL